jgi:polyferredoxin
VAPRSSDFVQSHAVAIPWLEQAGAVKALDRLGMVGAEGQDSRPTVATAGKRHVPKPVVRVERKKLLPQWVKRAVATEGKKKRPGSGLPARPSIRILVQLRRLSQATFLLLFCYLLVETGFRGTFGDGEVRLPHAVEGFLLTDPFVALVTLLSTHTVYHGLIWSLAVVVLTLMVGRAFCGWICPFGTLHHLAAWLAPSRLIRSKQRVRANQTKAWQVAKYYVLAGSLAAALAGSAIGGLLDPICIAVRAIGLGVLPLLQYVGVRATDTLAFSNHAGLQRLGDGTQDLLSQTLFPPTQPYFHQTWLILSLFGLVLFLNRIVPRFWCRALCPLGAMLGVLSKLSPFGMSKRHDKCTDCNLCLVHCQGADSPQGGAKHIKEECHLCFNCEAACPEDVIKFEFFPDRKDQGTAPNLDRRTVATSAGFAAIGIAGFRIGNWPDKNYNPKVIRPPGSVEEREFLERCIRCAECMTVCPNNALHPALFEAGIEGLWTPILVPRVGYCEFSCVLCGQVCPTGAIQKIDEKQKMGIGEQPIRIGTAMYDRGRCLPWAMATPCIVCEEFCPTSPKAIWTEQVSVPARPVHAASAALEQPTTVVVKRPYVDPQLCVGCGACEKVCPVVDQPAVYVTSAGESRSKTNVILLENSSYT